MSQKKIVLSRENQNKIAELTSIKARASQFFGSPMNSFGCDSLLQKILAEPFSSGHPKLIINQINWLYLAYQAHNPLVLGSSPSGPTI